MAQKDRNYIGGHYMESGPHFVNFNVAPMQSIQCAYSRRIIYRVIG